MTPSESPTKLVSKQLLDQLFADRDKLAERLRTCTQSIVEITGADGPKNLEDAIATLAERVKELEQRLASYHDEHKRHLILTQRLAEMEEALRWICLYDANHAATPTGAKAIREKAKQALEGEADHRPNIQLNPNRATFT